MKRVRLISKIRKTLRGSSGGFTLIEVLIALALVGIMAIVFASGLGTASRAVIIGDVRTNAESLARTQMEDIKTQDYIDYSKELSDPEREPDFYVQITIPSEQSDYTLEIIAEPIDPETGQPYNGDEGVFEDDNGIQVITVTASHEDSEIITLEGYKIDR